MYGSSSQPERIDNERSVNAFAAELAKAAEPSNLLDLPGVTTLVAANLLRFGNQPYAAAMLDEQLSDVVEASAKSKSKDPFGRFCRAIRSLQALSEVLPEGAEKRIRSQKVFKKAGKLAREADSIEVAAAAGAPERTIVDFRARNAAVSRTVGTQTQTVKGEALLPWEGWVEDWGKWARHTLGPPLTPKEALISEANWKWCRRVALVMLMLKPVLLFRYFSTTGTAIWDYATEAEASTGTPATPPQSSFMIVIWTLGTLIVGATRGFQQPLIGV